MRSLRSFEEIPKPKAIFFDVDETLLWYEGISDPEWYDLIWERIGQKFPELSKEDLMRMIGGDLPRTYPSSFGIDPKDFWRAVDEVILEKRKELAREGRIRKYEDSEALSRIELPKAAISNASQEATEFSLREVGLLGEFSLVLGKRYEDINSCKPNPGQILYACHKMGLSPKEVWFVGNGKGDMVASLRAGTFPIQILRGEELIKEAKVIIPSLWNLLDLLEVVLS